jgi:hypothetical protein
MASRIAIPCVERGDEGSRERQIRTLKLEIGGSQTTRGLSLLLVEMEYALKREGRYEERHHGPERISVVAVDHKGY